MQKTETSRNCLSTEDELTMGSALCAAASLMCLNEVDVGAIDHTVGIDAIAEEALSYLAAELSSDLSHVGLRDCPIPVHVAQQQGDGNLDAAVKFACFNVRELDRRRLLLATRLNSTRCCGH